MTPGDSFNPEQVDRQVGYWLDLADYDLETGRAMLESRRLLYVVFMCHQVIEKALKAVYVARHSTLAPRVHALVALAQRSGVYDVMAPGQQDFLETLDPMNIECRYPAEKEKLLAALTVSSCEHMLAETEELFGWIRQQLSNA